MKDVTWIDPSLKKLGLCGAGLLLSILPPCMQKPESPGNKKPACAGLFLSDLSVMPGVENYPAWVSWCKGDRSLNSNDSPRSL
jgi:hypothetical protein